MENKICETCKRVECKCGYCIGHSIAKYDKEYKYDGQIICYMCLQKLITEGKFNEKLFVK